MDLCKATTAPDTFNDRLMAHFRKNFRELGQNESVIMAFKRGVTKANKAFNRNILVVGTRQLEETTITLMAFTSPLKPGEGLVPTTKLELRGRPSLHQLKNTLHDVTRSMRPAAFEGCPIDNEVLGEKAAEATFSPVPYHELIEVIKLPVSLDSDAINKIAESIASPKQPTSTPTRQRRFEYAEIGLGL